MKLGERKRRKARQEIFKRTHPYCYICGSDVEEVEHMPPRILFARKMAPEEFEFPVCKSCNHNSSKLEQAAALLLSLKLTDENKEELERSIKIIKALKTNNEDIYREISQHMTLTQSKKHFRAMFGSELGAELRRAGYGLITFGPACENAIQVMSFKMFHALYYKETNGEIFRGRIAMYIAPKHSGMDIILKLVSWFPDVPLIKYRGNSEYKNFYYRFLIEDTKFLCPIMFDCEGQFSVIMLGIRNGVDDKLRDERMQEMLDQGLIEVNFGKCISLYP
ncbi:MULTISPECIES: hypothetical protein [Gluconobacter]|uniref:hypothetical protein n=1 Tax=Gluconobacter TaxID=441 RepID=UPI001B8C5D4D|nr:MULTISPECIES: hypothetical protein [Gluconobacter]MBS1023036.1 hypothetical protein [Gluconobacter cerinus]MBS1025453.1 hypothetical protein [Gluconobacter cerinus]MBS1054709.1 hypothetical protein [Gluconobacter kondonii]